MNFIFIPDKDVYRVHVHLPKRIAAVVTLITGKKFKRARPKPRYTRNLNKFRSQVYSIWSSECVKCGEKENLTIHHMLSYSEYPDFRLDPDLSVLLCIDCHAKFHKMYPNDYNMSKLYTWVWGSP